MSHTKEPWHIAPGGDYCDIVCQDHVDIARTDIEEDARRIVVCVNACAGISQQYIEELNGETLADRIMVLMTQRDEYSLLAYRRQNILDEVIKQRGELMAALDSIANESTRNLGSARIIARAAIASAKGGA